MGHISLQDVGRILDNYADVIEGGNVYAGGTSYKGIPGRQSNDAGLRVENDGTVTASSAGTTTTIPFASGSFDPERWEKVDVPGFFALCTTGDAENVNAARRITGWDNTAKEFTVDAFPQAVALNDVFTILQGFKRIPNQNDIEEDSTEVFDGFDRMFQIKLDGGSAGEVLPWFGLNTITYSTEMQVRLRIKKHGRGRDAIASAFENTAILRAILPLPEHRESTYTRCLLADENQQAEIIKEDENRVVILDTYTLIYRVDKTFK